ncbi:MAG: acetylglutamate kinase [Veillonella sp.]|nr:acetylglutamate kinase [Veillonella sp.]
MKDVTNAMRAHILTAAVPYIKQYTDQYVVVKYGGNAMIDEELKKSVMKDLMLLQLVGVKVVLVHGGGPAINSTLDAMKIESNFANGLRVTDEATMDVVQMVLAGKVNKGLVADLTHKQNDELGYVGSIDTIDTSIIDDVISRGYIPVISSIGMGADGKTYNINADTVAAKIAGALKAETMVAMTNIDGVLRDVHDPNSLISKITMAEADQLKAEGIIAGGMIPKVDCCLEAIKSGAQKVFIINGEIPHAILIELLTDEGLGTMFVK